MFLKGLRSFASCVTVVPDGKKMQKNSKKTVLLADTSKVGKKYIYNGFGFDCIDYVIMEKNPNHLELVKTLGKKLII